MVAHKRTEITVEADRVLIIRWRRSNKAWCPRCGREVDWVGLEEAETVTGMSGRALRDSARARIWHEAESSDGVELIRLESLLKSIQQL
jgi:hypothetical protein